MHHPTDRIIHTTSFVIPVVEHWLIIGLGLSQRAVNHLAGICLYTMSEVERSLMVRWVVGSILHGVDPLSYFSFQPVRSFIFIIIIWCMC